MSAPTHWLEGALDVHVHGAPSAFPRRASDLELAREARAARMRGLVLKAHEGDTSARAALVDEALGGELEDAAPARFSVLGGVVLNHFVGGVRAAAVEAAVTLGAAVVWMPTLHAPGHLAHYGCGGFAEQGSTLDEEVAEAAPVLAPDGGLLPEVHEVLDVLAAHPGVVLSNGHLGPAETLALFEEAARRGVERRLVTHPELPVSGFPLDVQRRLADEGAWIERCWLPHLDGWGGVAIETTAAEIGGIGPERCVLSTDLGQAANPAPTEGLAAFCQALAEAGLPEDAVRRMVRDNPAELLEVGSPPGDHPR